MVIECQRVGFNILRELGTLLSWLGRALVFRFAAVVLFSPLIIVVGAAAIPSMLDGLLVMRGNALINDSETTNDLKYITWLSMMTCALGIAMVRLILLYGPIRFRWTNRHMRHAYSFRVVNWCGAVLRRFDEAMQRATMGWISLFWTSSTRGWPLAILSLWLLVGLTFPLQCRSSTCFELLFVNAVQEKNDEALALSKANDQLAQLEFLRTGGAAIVIGVLSAVVTLWLFAMLRFLWATWRKQPIAPTGMILGEGMIYTLLGKRYAQPGSEQTAIQRHRGGHVGSGFTDPQTKRLLPGHQQMFVTALISIAVYLVVWTVSWFDSTWTMYRFPAGFYILVLTYSVGTIVGGLAYILDRFHVPLLVMAAIYLLAIAPIGDHDRYFELIYEPAEHAKVEIRDSSEAGARGDNATNNAFLAAYHARPDSSAGYADRPYLMDILDKYELPSGMGGKRTLVVVTASGGGIQASAWTARVLTGLGERLPWFDQSIGLLSGVSGGSVGVMQYLAHRGLRAPEGGSMSLTPDTRQKIRDMASASSLEAVSWGVAFPDFARMVLPFKILRTEIDRGFALESSWWNRMGAEPADRDAMRELRLRDLTQMTADAKFPPVIFNATLVETGQRVLISPIRTNSVARPTAPATPPSPPTPEQRSSDLIGTTDVPIDLLEFYGEALRSPLLANPRLSTAVRLSATFAYVTPAARPLPIPVNQLLDRWRDSADVRLTEQEREALANRFDLHLVDGGYSDNAGLVSAIKVVHQLINEIHNRAASNSDYALPFDQILFLRIEPFPRNRPEIVAENSGLSTALLAPSTTLGNARVSSQAERGDLEMELLIAFVNQEHGRLAKLLEQDLVESYIDLAQYGNARWPLFEELVFDKPGMSQLDNWLYRMPTLGAEPEPVAFSMAVANIRERLDAGLPTASELEEAIEEAATVSGQLATSLAMLLEKEAVCKRKLKTYEKFSKSQVRIYSFLCQFGETSQFDDKTFSEFASQISDAQNAEVVITQTQLEAVEPTRREPPLSWLLSPSDLAILDHAWIRIDDQFEPPVATTTTASSETIAPAADTIPIYRERLTPNFAESIVTGRELMSSSTD